jgi:hypothetical protein
VGKQFPGSEEMSKTLMACPFSGKACMECAVYRGRHFHLCFAKGDLRKEWDTPLHSYVEIPNSPGKEDQTLRGMNNIPNPRMISDVEDLIEAEEFSRFEEKRRKA